MENVNLQESIKKPFLTVDEQISLLFNRKLKIKSNSRTKKFLLENNYYRISGYTNLMRNNDRFFSDTSFNNIMDIYNFDIKFRNVISYFLEIAEVHLKSIYIYKFSEKHGPFGYLKPENFSNYELYSKTIKTVKYYKNKRVRYEKYLKHYKNDLPNNKLPFWVIIEMFTLSNIDSLYSISPIETQNDVAKMLGLNFNFANMALKNYMDWLVMLRNICAHGGRIYGRGFPGTLKITKNEMNKIDMSYFEKNEIPFFGYMFIFKKILSEDMFLMLKNKMARLERESKQYGKYCALKYYGFPDNWKEII